MKPRDVVAAYKKRYWIIILIVLLAALISTVISRVQTPTYKVEIVMTATPPKSPTTKMPDAMIGMAYAAAMPSIADAAESLDVAERVSERLQKSDINLSPGELLKRINAAAVANTTSLKVTVTDSSPVRVAEIANTWGEVCSQYLSESPLLLNGTLNFTNRAMPPEKAAMPKPLVYLGISIFFGLLLGFSLIIGMEYFDPHFRSLEEAEEILEAPVLGMLPRERGVGKKAFISSIPPDSFTYEAYTELRTRLIFSPSRAESRTIALAMAIPLESGPYFSANLAMGIALTGHKTLLVDGDMREQAVSKILKASERIGLAQVLEGKVALHEAIMRTNIHYLHLLGAGKTGRNPTDLLSQPLFEEVLRELEDEYEWVILSTPPLSTSVDAALIASKGFPTVVVIDLENCTRSIAMMSMGGFKRLQVKPAGLVLYGVKVGRKERTLRSLRFQEEVSTQTGLASSGSQWESGKRRKEAPSVEAGERSTRTNPMTMKENTLGSAEGKLSVTDFDVDKEASKASPSVFMVEEGREKDVFACKETEKKPESDSEEKLFFREPSPEEGWMKRGFQPPGSLMDITAMNLEDARRLGEKGVPIPKHWIEAIYSDDGELRKTAKAAIASYCEAFLAANSKESEENRNIMAAITDVLNREGEYTSAGGRDLEGFLKRILARAVPRPSSKSD